jgi:hypothetical protein
MIQAKKSITIKSKASAITTPASTPSSGAIPKPNSSLLKASEAARFLMQATMGATRPQIARVQAIGYSAWLNEQFAMPALKSVNLLSSQVF